mgnify:CR=1 FL=1
MEPLIEARNLVKHYGATKAVDDVSFSVRRGECFGFLGPNGAGKTTTMRMIYGFSPMTGGKLSVLGLSVKGDIRPIKRRLGVVPQENSLDPELTVYQNLTIYGRYYDLSPSVSRQRAEELLDLFHLT